uniref:CSON009287 protein n=1 Tax=Culicoides sonorensis TaxID=179676 RepID=A0A336M009_CULSO
MPKYKPVMMLHSPVPMEEHLAKFDATLPFTDPGLLSTPTYITLPISIPGAKLNDSQTVQIQVLNPNALNQNNYQQKLHYGHIHINSNQSNTTRQNQKRYNGNKNRKFVHSNSYGNRNHFDDHKTCQSNQFYRGHSNQNMNQLLNNLSDFLLAQARPQRTTFPTHYYPKFIITTLVGCNMTVLAAIQPQDLQTASEFQLQGCTVENDVSVLKLALENTIQ